MADPTGAVIPVAPVSITVTCDSDLSAKFGFAVTLDTTDEQNVNLAAAATAFPFPVLEGADGSAAKKVMTIAIGGTCLLKAGGAIAPGDKLTSDGSGKWIATVTDHQFYGAIALEIGATDDEIVALVSQGTVSA